MYVQEGAEGVGEHWLIKLANAKAFTKEGKGQKTGRANYVWIVTHHECGAEGTLVPKPGMEGEAEALGGGKSVWRKLMILQGKW